MKVVFMEISSSMEFQSHIGCVVRGALLPEGPGYLWFHCSPQVLHTEFPSSAFPTSQDHLYQISLLILTFKTFRYS